jgi:hypothetical protein
MQSRALTSHARGQLLNLTYSCSMQCTIALKTVLMYTHPSQPQYAATKQCLCKPLFPKHAVHGSCNTLLYKLACQRFAELSYYCCSVAGSTSSVQFTRNFPKHSNRTLWHKHQVTTLCCTGLGLGRPGSHSILLLLLLLQAASANATTQFITHKHTERTTATAKNTATGLKSSFETFKP